MFNDSRFSYQVSTRKTLYKQCQRNQHPRLIVGLDDECSIQDLLWGPDAAAEDVTAVESTAEDGTADDGMAELSKKGGRYGGIT